MTAPTARETEEMLAALAESYAGVDEPEVEGEVIEAARALVARAAAFRAAATAARPVVEKKLRLWCHEGIGATWDAVFDALDSDYMHGDTAILAAYDRYCIPSPPPDGEPPEVAILVHALAELAVREMEARK